MKSIDPTRLLCALLLGLAACKGTSSDGDAGSGAAGGMDSSSPMAGHGGVGASGGAAGVAGTTGGGSGAGTGGRSGAGGSGAGGNGGGAGGGANGGAGGMMDAAVEDSGTPQTASCAEGTYLLCEDFEDTAVGGIPDGWTAAGEPVAVTDAQAASGLHSLECGPQVNGWRRIERDFSSFPTTHWGRVRFKVKTPVPDAFVHSTMIEFRSTSPVDDAHPDYRVVDTVKMQVEGFDGSGDGNWFQWIYNVQPYSRPEFGRGSDYDWKFDDQWHCAEWYIDSVEQAYRFFYDGEEVESMALHNGPGVYDGPHTGDNDDDNTEIPSVFETLRVGWNNYQESPPGFTAWLDDFAIGTERVPCPQ